MSWKYIAFNYQIDRNMCRKVNEKHKNRTLAFPSANFNHMGIKGAIHSVYMYPLVVGQGHLHACTLLTAYFLRTWLGKGEWVCNSRIIFPMILI